MVGPEFGGIAGVELRRGGAFLPSPGYVGGNTLSPRPPTGRNVAIRRKAASASMARERASIEKSMCNSSTVYA